MLKLEFVPNGIDEIIEYYGVAGNIENGKFKANREWRKENLGAFYLSFSLRQSWNNKEIKGFIAHKKVGHVMADALEEIHKYYGLTFMQRHKLDQWGGVYNPRFKKGSNEPSTHAWAIAIDYCPNYGPYGQPSRMPWSIVEVFLQRGFTTIDHDGMHFSACRNY